MAITKVTTPVAGFKSAVDIGLKIPVGTNSNLPTGVEGMIRNDTDEDSGGANSTTAITFYNGTDWKYFTSAVSQDSPPIENFNTVIWNGDATTTRSITGVGFDPDLVWVKKRSGGTARNHSLHDVVRGAGNRLNSNTTSAGTDVTNEVKSFINDGFTIGNGDEVNGSGSSQKYVAWCFKAGGLINKAADFNGSSSIIQSSISKTVLANNFSVSFWWKPDLMNTFQVPMGGLYDETVSPAIAYGWMVFQGSDNKMYLYWITSSSPNNSNSISNNVVLEKGKWYNIVVSKTSSSASIYVNTSSAASAPSQGNVFNIVYNANPSFYIGKRNVSNNYADGTISQVRVFNDVLTSSEVTELYGETKADNSVLNYPTGAGCIAAYPLGENANGLDGLYNGTASNVTFGLPGYLNRNNQGTIESTVSANDALGFSIASYTGVGGSLKTIGHGLDAAPEMIIVKSTSNSDQWWVWHKDLTSIDYYLILSGINPETYYVINEGLFGRTLPTSTVFSVGYNSETNGSGRQYISYCFTSKPGFSKVGNYTGNGINNPVDIGFEPAFVMIKNTTSNASWAMFDNKRTTANPSTSALYANEAIMEEDLQLYFEFTSTGFKNLQSSNTLNTSGSIYIYLAFAK